MGKNWIGRWALFGALVACGGTTDGSSVESSGGAPDAGDPNSDVGGAGGAPGAAGSDIDAGGASGAAGADGGSGGRVSVPDLTSPVAKIDLLLMVDNSISMADKQEVLRLAVPDIVGRLVNPVCVDSEGNQFTPPAPGEACPEGQRREFNAISDLNVGIVTSSLGDVGAEMACPQLGSPDYRTPDRVDMAHLVGSLERSQVQGDTPQGFLAWRPGSVNLDDFNADVQQMVRDVGDGGCGWEASLESWYRFLVDPFPYRQLVRVQCPGSSSASLNCVQPATDTDGLILLDETLLAQRAAFSRPDALLVIMMLTDENDCSLQVGNQTWVVADIQDTRPMFRGSSQCAVDPNHKCCYSCPLGPPTGCSADPICNGDAESGVLQNRLPDDRDGINLRCYQQKRRFGVDFLYPTQRYVNALSQLELCWNATDLSTEGCAPDDIVPNPLYGVWDRRERVFLAGIIGVPWQAISSPNDVSGQALSDPSTQLRFKSSAEMSAPGDVTWAQILGSPGVAWRAARGGREEVASVPAVPPSLAQMVESELPRNDVTNANPMNGREYDTTQGSPEAAPDDLQYACIFPLSTPRDCSALDISNGDPCDCYEGELDRPLCEQNPGESTPGTTQYSAKAYPGARHLAVLKGYGDNAIVTSICARNVTDPTRPDFGYRPAAQAIIERLNAALRSP